MYVDATGATSRIGITTAADGKKTRVLKKTKKAIA
jgi:hypothetical protein